MVFLIGVATSTSAIQRALPRSTTHLLEMAHFFVEPGIAGFNALIKGVSLGGGFPPACTDIFEQKKAFIDWTAPLSIGPLVYETLLAAFKDSHHSIDATISSLQVSLASGAERDSLLNAVGTLVSLPATL